MDLTGRKVLVTGGAGFIGSALVEFLLSKGCEVTAYDSFDDFYPGKEENLGPYLNDKDFRLVRGNILDFDSLNDAMGGVSVVFHEAAQAGVRYGIDHPRDAHETNVTGTLNVLEAARKNEVEKVVYASSSSVYGNPVSLPMVEDHPPSPTNPYGATKLAAEKYCIAYQRTYGLKTVCLRYFSVYGPRGRPDQVITAFTNIIARGGRPRIFGDGKQSRDFTYISDVVSATYLGAAVDVDGEIINVGYGKDLSIEFVARKVAEGLGKDVQPDFVKGYEGDFPQTLCSNSKALHQLGWRPKVPFEEGLSKYLEWYRAKMVRPLSS
ncbi:MAG: NAD-dependent epimerase/dehydratase family protein [Thaumarchaeota archaeon]|nr:NAD-dependent epimerase/dehydratase family protein [Nitrososphaerota archaeon]